MKKLITIISLLIICSGLAAKDLILYQPLLDKKLIIIPEKEIAEGVKSVEGTDIYIKANPTTGDVKLSLDDEKICTKAEYSQLAGRVTINEEHIELKENKLPDGKRTLLINSTASFTTEQSAAITANTAKPAETRVNQLIETKGAEFFAGKKVVQEKISIGSGMSMKNVGDDGIELSATGAKSFASYIFKANMKYNGTPLTIPNDAWKGNQIMVTISEEQMPGTEVYYVASIGFPAKTITDVATSEVSLIDLDPPVENHKKLSLVNGGEYNADFEVQWNDKHLQVYKHSGENFPDDEYKVIVSILVFLTPDLTIDLNKVKGEKLKQLLTKHTTK